MAHKFFRSISKDPSTEFILAKRNVAKFFRRYSIKDIATSLFVSNTWLPNIASPVKHLFLTLIFASLDPGHFSTSDSISSYRDFRRFLKKLFTLLPTFPLLEDYVPELDWGDVKFHYEGYYYKIFYGSELENVYDYITLFQMLYEPFDQEYLKTAGRSPMDELKSCLQLQNDIISGINSQPLAEPIKDLEPGHIEIPPSEFWENVAIFYSRYEPKKRLNESIMMEYSEPLGTITVELLELEEFINNAYKGKLLPTFFITDGTQYYLILPRSFSPVLFDTWTKIFEDYQNEVVRNGNSYHMRICVELHKYIRERIRNSNLFPLVSAITQKGQPHEIVFSSAFISRNKLVLIYITNPNSSNQTVEDELAQIAPLIGEAVNLIRKTPHKLGLHLEKKVVQLQSKNSRKQLEPLLFVLIPQTSTTIEPVSIPDSLPGKIMFLDQFLGIIDELEDGDSLTYFIDYLDEIEDKVSSPLISPLDEFASYKSSYGVLINGALDYTAIMLDPHWGSNMRYESLAEFWKIFPEVNFYRHPRSWNVTKETESRIRLEARGYFEIALYCKIRSTHIFLNAPFHVMSFEQGNFANLLLECLEDSLSRHNTIIEQHKFFDIYDQFQVSFFPYSLISKGDDFRHLRHLNPKEENWCSDRGIVVKGIPGVRVVFNEKSLIKAFESVIDSSLEVELLLEVLTHLNEIVPDPHFDSIEKSIVETKPNQPRFRISRIKKEASFPDLVHTYEPLPFHYKKANKRIAELAKSLNLSEGSYSLEKAKVLLNHLRTSIVSEINKEVSKYNFKRSIPYLLTHIDALTHRYELDKMGIEEAATCNVDYNREEKLAELKTKYIVMHKNYRYLIEKFIQLQPKGKSVLKKDQFQYLIALVNWVLNVYHASDCITYEINPVGMSVDKDYKVKIQYEGDVENKQKIFGKEQAQLDLYLLGNQRDRVDSSRPVVDFLNELDMAFKEDLGFGLRNMMSVLFVLSKWTDYNKEINESTYYTSEGKSIEKICLKNIKGINRNEVKPILEFLTLKNYDVIRILDTSKHVPCKAPCEDIPIWEHKKRYARYTIKPLILIDDRYYWGSYSTLKAGHSWSNVSSGTLPANMPFSTIKNVLNTEKKLIEKALEVKALDILKRYTAYADSNVKLHRRDKKGSHPAHLGDYDVLAFVSEKNVILNIECKDILPAYCLKDAKTVRETIFGKPGKNDGHLKQIIKRQDYLTDHLAGVVKALSWPVDVNKQTTIIPIYLSRRDFWWTRFPPKGIAVIFLRVDLLSQFIEDL